SGGPGHFRCDSAESTSRSIREIRSIWMPLGQAAVHSPIWVQPPNPSASCWATMSSTRVCRSGCPCGSMPRWATFAAMNSEADPFGQSATQAPQPMQVAASNAASASVLFTGMEFASGAVPVGAVMYPPAWMIRSKEERSTTRSLITVNGSARQGSTSITSPSVQLAVGDGLARTVGEAVDHQTAHAADALTTVGVERDRVLPLEGELLVEHVQHLQEGHVLGDVGHLVGVHLPGCVTVGLTSDPH